MNKIAKKRKPDTHKGDYGHVLVVAGSTGMTGAAYLTSEAAVLMGSGLVTCAIPKSLNNVMESKLTEAMTLPVEDRGKGFFQASASNVVKDFSGRVQAAAIGPGISQADETKKFIEELITALDVPIVLDADGINCIAGRPQLIKKAKKCIIVTPHAGEMSRLIGKKADYIRKNRKKITCETAKKYNVTVALKGKNTIVATHDGSIYVNDTGNPGMASGGVGDVLTGMIVSLIGQGFDPFSAAKCGVYVHGLAGDIAAKEKGEVSLRAQDILDNIPRAVQVG